MGAWEGRRQFGIQAGARVVSSARPMSRVRTMTSSCASVVENECVMDSLFTRIAVRDVLGVASVSLIASV